MRAPWVRGRGSASGSWDAPGAGSERLFYGWLLVAVLGTTTVISYGTTAYAFGVLVVPISAELGWSRGALAGAYSVSLLLAGLLGVPVGRLVDRHGARAVMSLGSVVGGLALLGLAGVQELGQFYLLWGVGVGLANALTFYPVSFTVVANWFERRRGGAMAWLTTIGGLASPVFIPLGGALVTTLGWRGTLVAFALANLLLALPLHALVVRRHPEDLGLLPDGRPPAERKAARPVGTAALPGLEVRAALRQPAFWLLTVSASLDQLAVMVVWVHQIAFMVSRGFDPQLAANVAGVVGLMSLPGRFFLNRLSDRVGPQPLLAVVLAAIGLGIGVLAAATSLAWLALYVLVYGLAFGARSPLRASVMAEHFGRRAYGAITAIQGIAVALASAFGPLAAGWLYDRLGSYDLAFWLTAGAFLLAAAIIVGTASPGRTRLAWR
jgi:MFS family permease